MGSAIERVGARVSAMERETSTGSARAARGLARADAAEGPLATFAARGASRLPAPLLFFGATDLATAASPLSVSAFLPDADRVRAGARAVSCCVGLPPLLAMSTSMRAVLARRLSSTPPTTTRLATTWRAPCSHAKLPCHARLLGPQPRTFLDCRALPTTLGSVKSLEWVVTHSWVTYHISSIGCIRLVDLVRPMTATRHLARQDAAVGGNASLATKRFASVRSARAHRAGSRRSRAQQSGPGCGSVHDFSLLHPKRIEAPRLGSCLQSPWLAPLPMRRDSRFVLTAHACAPRPSPWFDVPSRAVHALHEASDCCFFLWVSESRR